MSGRMRLAERGAWVAALALFAVVAVCALVTPNAFGRYTGLVTNSSNTVATGYFLCSAASVGDSAWLSYSLNESGGSTATNRGTYSNGNGTYQSKDSSTVSFQPNSTGPCKRDTGFVTLTNPNTGYNYAAFVNGPGAGLPAGTTSANLTQEIWFRTALGYNKGGTLMSISNKQFTDADSNFQGNSSTSKDHQLYMDNTGNVRFVLWNGATSTATQLVTPTVLNDGQWHQVVATTSTTAGTCLYVDGQLSASSSVNVSSNNANASNVSYLHIGFDNLAGWPTVPTNYGINASLAYAVIYRSTLSASQVSLHYRASR